MKAETKIVDNFSKKLESLYNGLHDTTRMDKVLKGIGEEFSATVNEMIPTWNPNLMYSGMNPSFWNLFHEDNISKIEIIYSGFTGAGFTAPKNLSKGVWWEFSKHHIGGVNDVLARDYAYYQEFGEDKYAPDSKYKAKPFSGHHFVGATLADSEYIVLDNVELYVQELLSQVG